MTVGSGAAAPVACRPRVGARRSAGRRGARRPRPARRSSRRLRPPSAGRPSAGGAGSRRARAPPPARRCRPAIRQTSVDVPPMSSEIAFSTPASARDPRRPDDARRRPGDERERRVRAPPRQACRRRRRSASRAARGARPRCSGPRAPRGTRRGRARGKRRRRSSRPARTRGTRARPRARRPRSRPGAAGAPPPRRGARGSGRGRRRGGRPRPLRPRSPGASSRSSGSSTPCGPDALADAEAALQRDERLGVAVAEAVEMGARLPPQVQDVLEAGGGDEGRARALALEERVRGDRRPVREALERRPVAPTSAAAFDHRVLLRAGGRHLRRAELAVVEEHGVREGASDVDSEDRHAARLPWTADATQRGGAGTREPSCGFRTPPSSTSGASGCGRGRRRPSRSGRPGRP